MYIMRLQGRAYAIKIDETYADFYIAYVSFYVKVMQDSSMTILNEQS